MIANLVQQVIAYYFSQIFAILESIRRDELYLFWQDDFLDATSHKSILPNVFKLFRQFNMFEIGASIEQKAADESHLIRKFDSGNLWMSFEYAFKDHGHWLFGLGGWNDDLSFVASVSVKPEGICFREVFVIELLHFNVDYAL